MFPEWYKEAERLYTEEKLSYAKIGERLGVGRKTVSYWLRKGGHKSNIKYYPNVDHSKYRKYKISEDVFSVIDTEEKAYWLGFFYADANISDRNNDIEVGLQEIDYEHLVKLQEFFQTDRPIYPKEKRENGKIYKGYRLIVASSKIKSDLIRLGCYPRKSKTLQFPASDQVPSYLIHHFIRGYFDGDGCITKANGGKSLAIELLGTEEFLKKYLEWCNTNHQVLHSFNHCSVTMRAQHFGEEAKDILDRLYGEATIYLERKHNLYKNLCLAVQ